MELLSINTPIKEKENQPNTAVENTNNSFIKANSQALSLIHI